MFDFSTDHIVRLVMGKWREQCSIEENTTPHESIVWWNIWEKNLTRWRNQC